MQRNRSEWPSDVARLRPLMLAHLDRLEIWSIASFLAGLALPLMIQNRTALMFGLVSSGWAGVNILIALIGKKAPPPRSILAFARLLSANQVSNGFYIVFGIFFGLSSETIDWRAAGWAVCLQGIALMVLDARFLRQVRKLVRDHEGN
jgi:hypothetical protein